MTLDIEGVLAGHEYVLGIRHGGICACGFVPDVDPESLATQQDYHRAHVAAVLREQIARWITLAGPGLEPSVPEHWEAVEKLAFGTGFATALAALAEQGRPGCPVPRAGGGIVSGGERLPNGLTVAQDAAFDDLARAIASHINGDPECDCDLHPRVPSTSEGEGA